MKANVTGGWSRNFQPGETVSTGVGLSTFKGKKRGGLSGLSRLEAETRGNEGDLNQWQGEDQIGLLSSKKGKKATS